MSTSAQPPPGARPIRAGLVALGLLLGVVLTWAVQVALALALEAAPGPRIGGGAPLGDGLPLIPVLLPAAVGIVLLLIPRWRQVGAGLLMGMAIGSIVGAGVCVAVLGAL